MTRKIISIVPVLVLLLLNLSRAMIITAEANPELSPGIIELSQPFSIDIYFDDDGDAGRMGFSLPFIFYSPDGGISSITHHDVGGDGSSGSIIIDSLFDEAAWLLFLIDIDWNNQLPEMINIAYGGGALGGCGSSWYYTGNHKYISFNFIIDDIGRFCIDSLDPDNDVYDWIFEAPSPSFNGPYCWYVMDTLFTADFSGTPTFGRPPLAVMFDPVDKNPTDQFYWDFGDSETSTERNPIHYYTEEGTFDVMLKVSRDLGDTVLTDSLLKEDYISVTDLHAAFGGSPVAGSAPLMVQFTDSSAGNPNSWYWDFGDGQYSYDQNPTHPYNDIGYYDVFLKVTNPLGYADSVLKIDYIQVGQAYTDLFVELSSPSARPGMLYWYNCNYTNIGTFPAMSTELRILKPPEMSVISIYDIQINSGIYSGYSYSGDTIVIPLQTIMPSIWFGGYIMVFGTLAPGATVGDTLVGKAWITTITQDEDTSSNQFILNTEVVGDVGPHHKSAYPGGVGFAHNINVGSRLTYTIEFENPAGSPDNAVFIRITDTLDENLDWGTMAVTDISHPALCYYEFDAYTGALTWYLDSIMLPPNNSPPEGEGHVSFAVNTKSDLPVGTKIENRAWIRFDYDLWKPAPSDKPLVRTIGLEIKCGDVNADGLVNIFDITYLISYLYKEGPPPVLMEAGDVNSDNLVNIFDITYLISFLYKQGPPPMCIPLLKP